jgi:heterodisulfide reductase subunit C
MVWQQPTGLAAECSPVGLWLAGHFRGFSESEARSSHLLVWWIHAALVFGFIASIPFTRLFHFVAAPLNIFFARPGLGALAPVTIEDVERDGRVGPAEIRHLSAQQLLSLDACMQCGRCDEVCPALATGKPLSPQGVVQDLKKAMEDTARRPAEAAPALGTVISPETLWSCTACSACVQTCPARINQLEFILSLRRQLVADGVLSGPAATALRRMQSHGNPWGLPAADRDAWAKPA